MTLKERIIKFLHHSKIYSKKQIISAAIFPAALIYFEAIFRIISVKEVPGFWWWLAMICASIVGGLLLTMLCTVTKNEKINNIIGLIVLQAASVIFMIVHFVGFEFNIYIGPQGIFGGAGGVAGEASDYIFQIITGNWTTILIFEIPILLYILFLILRKISFQRFRGIGYVQILMIATLVEVIAALPICNLNPSWKIATREFTFDTSVKFFGVQTSTKLDTLYAIFKNPFKMHFIIENDPPVISNKDSYHLSDIDFNYITDHTTEYSVLEINKYVKSQMPAKKNEYTGMFKGKNLIQITAESFTPYVVDKELTPILYRLINNGIRFENYYQPLWNGSTTTGEFLIMTGLLPANGYYSMLETVGDNMHLTIGNQLLKEGYTSIAYHNGTYDYFDRNLTHCNLGYSRYVANGSGMYGLSGRTAWPQSDVEMMQFSIPRYIDKTPFNIYYMTLSGHSKYDSKNFIVNKNIAEVRAWAERKGYDYTNAVLSYIAANLEFEKSMEYLLQQLEDAGILEDTVIVMTADHYPYSLSDDYVIDEKGHVDYFNVEANLINMFGFTPEINPDYHHNALVIWTPSLEGENSIVVTDPVQPVDILPTVSNLFGFDYDSRLLAGRDVFDMETEPLVIFSDYSWLSSYGYYDYRTETFIPIEELKTSKETIPRCFADHGPLKTLTYENPIDKANAEKGITTYGGYAKLDDYIKHTSNVVQNKMVLSQNIPLQDYYGLIWGKIKTQDETLGQGAHGQIDE
ncbi:MAG: LTA synthase family protein [Lachnospiraceae bacterium]|nr:LTA synthase family protein [Lachnospiraceae bacterium]